MRRRKWLLPAVLPLTCAGLLAQERAQEPAQPSPATESTAAPKEEAAAPEPRERPDEQVSADNNLSFPVDI